jgi:hypothetical protein
MSTRTAFVWGLGLCFSFAASVSGCKWEHGEDEEDCGWGDDEEGDRGEDGRDPAADAGVSRPERPGVCDAFCDRLVACGTLANDARDACAASCAEAHVYAPSSTEAGAQCVIEQACQPVDAYDCAGAPLPETSESENACESESESEEGAPPTACEVNCDCPAGQICTEGFCG